ncbi:MAG: FtsX-like permease family protein, partial [Mycobacterium leprae]
LRLGEGQYQRLLGQSGPLRYAAAPSPYPDRWPLAFKLAVAAGDVRASFPPDTADRQNALQLGPVLRSWQPTGDRGQYQYQVRGYFDPTRLSVALDPRTQMPLMTYRPAEATRVLDQAGRPVNPPQLLSGGLSPVSFLSAPPVLLTTMEGAVALAGDRAINAIQIKAKDAEHFTPETVARVQALAAEIERRTGLVAEVTMGSSPVGVLVQVPDRGWVEELWIHKNASVTTVQQVEFGYSSYAVLLIAVAALYTVVTALTGVNARRRELGVTIALGWPDRAMRSMVMGEQLLFALLAGALAALAATLAHAPPTMILVVLGLAVLIYLPAIWLSGLVAVRTAPGEALRWGDTAPGRRVVGGAGVVPLALSSLLGRPGRTLLTVVAIALPTALLILLTFIGRYLRGVLYTTITGQYAAMRVGPVQYAAGIVALAVAAVTAFDLIRQNAIDHRSERALLHALGWPQRWIAATMVAEGTLLGLAAGIAGELFGILLLALLYGFKVAGVAQIAAVAWLLPVLLGCLTGLASTLVEFRSWNRAGLAAVRPEEVSRSGRGYRVVGVTMLLVLLGCVGGLAIYRWAGEWQARRAVGPSVGERTESAIAAVVAQQNGALADLDLNAYQATLDPANPPYVTEEQHWLEDARTWKALNPGGRITRTVAKVQLLGDNTANVWIRQQLEGAKPASSVLETVWTRSAEGQWREYGRQHLVLQEGNLTLWYPPSVPEATARRVLTAAQNDLDTLRRMGYTLPESQLFELFANEDAFRDSLGPYLAGAGVAQVWVEVGEPLRFYMNDSLPNFAYHLLTVAAITQTHNQAPLWLREGIRLYGDAAMGGLSVQDEIRRFPAVPLLPPTQLGSIPGNVDRNADSYAQVSISGMAFVWYLQETYGPQTVKQICDALAREPLDLRLEGPETDAQRIRLAEQAVEQVTGQRLADLSEQFERWARTLEVKR